MIFLRILRFLQGYVSFRITGEFPERLLNIFAVNGIGFFGANRCGNEIHASMYASDYKKVKELRAGSRTKTQIYRKKGLPFILKKYRQRTGLGIGFVLFIVIINFMSLFVWNVQVSGNVTIETSKIIDACEKLGIKEGALRKSIDTQRIKYSLQLMLEEISWAAINIEGSRVTIEISENKMIEDFEEVPSNLCAKVDGVITYIEVLKGNISVKVGDAVSKGDLLVSGTIGYADGKTVLRQSEGIIVAKTERKVSEFIPYKQTVTRTTGDSKKKRVLSVFGLNIPMFLGSVKGEYIKTTEILRPEFSETYLPISIITAKFNQLETVNIELSNQEILEQYDKKLSQLKVDEDLTVLSSDQEISYELDGLTITTNLICEENIAIPKILLINTIN